MRLQVKRGLITGARRGIGRATAVRFAQEGADVVVADLDPADVQDTAEVIEQSGRSAVAVPYINAYGPTKAAVINMTRSLAVEWAKYHINVNCVAPCWTRTGRLDAAVEKGFTSWEEIRKRCPMGRPAEPEEVAAAILFLALDDAGFITGVTLPVDGGWLAYGYQTV